MEVIEQVAEQVAEQAVEQVVEQVAEQAVEQVVEQVVDVKNEMPSLELASDMVVEPEPVPELPEDRMIMTVFSDGSNVPVAERVLWALGSVSTMFGDLEYKQGQVPLDANIPISNVSRETFDIIIRYIEHHIRFPVYVDDAEDTKRRKLLANQKRHFLGKFDQQLMEEIGLEKLYDVLNAVNYLDLKGLLDAGCMHIANTIKGKTPDELVETFGVRDIFPHITI